MFDEVNAARSGNAALGAACDALKDAFADKGKREFRSRLLVEKLAHLWQAALLIQNAPTAIADAFITTRIVAGHGPLFGRLDDSRAVSELLQRALAT